MTRKLNPILYLFDLFIYLIISSLLVAATENKKVLIFSSSTHKMIKEINRAHNSCVNLVKFLDSRIFSTCSDDNSIAIWDLRNLSQKIKSLNGHKNWVKSIEYDSSKGILLSSAYDNCVLQWDINSSSDTPNLVLEIKNMLRMVLTPDCNKMIVSTSEGYIMIIHDLNLETLFDDLKEFVPDLYLYMQMGRSRGIDMGSWANSLFTNKTNRVELITDFPKNDKNGYITTLDVHPYGWALLSRNTSGDDLTEWSCVHDIQDSVRPLEFKTIYRSQHLNSRDQNINLSLESSSTGNNNRFDSIDSTQSSESPIFVTSNQMVSSQQNPTVFHRNKQNRNNKSDSEFKIYKNIPRLLYYMQELNKNQGFIKELCFSPDGRIICSPYDFGYRLLSFNSNCTEMSDCIGNKPKKLFELKKNLSHPDYVVTTKFSPIHCQIASGCLKGRVVFSQPIL